MKRMLAAAACAAIFVTPGALAAPLAQGQWAGAFNAGAEFAIDGDVHGGAVAGVGSLAALNPNLPAAPAELRIQSRSFDDIYGEALTYSFEAAYGLGSNREALIAIRRVEADEGSVQVGTAFVPALSAELPVFGTFGEYKSTAIEVGLRQYFGEAALRPYVAGRVGVAQIDEIDASFTVPVPDGVGAEPNDIALSNVAFYGESTTYTLGLDVGVSYDVGERFSLAVETGLRYQGELDGDDSAIGGLGLASINDEGSRWSAPVTVRASYRF